MRLACFCGTGCLALAASPAAAAPRCCPRVGLGGSCRLRLVHCLALRRSRRDSLSRLGHLTDNRDDLDRQPGRSRNEHFTGCNLQSTRQIRSCGIKAQHSMVVADVATGTAGCISREHQQDLFKAATRLSTREGASTASNSTLGGGSAAMRWKKVAMEAIAASQLGCSFIVFRTLQGRLRIHLKQLTNRSACTCSDTTCCRPPSQHR